MARGYVLGECGRHTSPLDFSRVNGEVSNWHERTVPKKQSYYTIWLVIVKGILSGFFTAR